MANQPKKYRKFLVGAASAALVATAVAPVVGAAESKFTDIGGYAQETQDQINSLVDAGIITGTSATTFSPSTDISRGQVVKLLGRYLVESGNATLPADWNTNQRFSDVPVNYTDADLVKNAAIVFDAGVFKGNNGVLNSAGKITRENMALVLDRAAEAITGYSLQDIAGNESSNVTDINTAKAEARGAIKALNALEISTVNVFKPKNNVQRVHFATFLSNAIDVIGDIEDVAAGVKSINATNTTTVEVTFEDAIDNINSLNFTIEGLTVTNAAVKQTDNKVVVLTTAAQTGGQKYAVTLNDEAIGSFEGISAVIPTKIDITTHTVQGKVGQQAILTADVGVKQAGIPVTFNVKANTIGTLNKDQVFEAVTNAEGIATFSYSQYNAGVDEVVAYPTGAPTSRDYATVHWGVDTILALEEDDKKGATLNNGENKVYKVTYKDPKTGKPVANKELNVTFAENVDVAINKITDATINGKNAYQTTNDKLSVVTIKTDSKGQATFTVSGTNTKATPVVFEDGSGYGQNSVNKLDRTELNVAAPELTFGAVHVNYDIEISRDGGEEAATGPNNGRKYKITAKDENGKAAAGEVVNVAFDEVLDRVISTNTNAEFVIDNADLKGTTKYYNANNKQQVQITLDSKGEGEVKIVSTGSNANKDYATPVIWIDINTSNNKDGVLEEGEPTKTAAMTYFADEKIQGSKLKVYNYDTNTEIKDNRTVNGADKVEFRFDVANQSGSTFGGAVSEFNATFQVTNTGSKDVYVWKDAADVGNLDKATIISTRRGETFTLPRTNEKQVKLYVASNGETASVDVTVYGEAKGNKSDDKFVRLDESKVAKASFVSSTDLGTSHTGDVAKFDKDKKKLTFVGKKELDYKEEFDAKKVKYEDARGTGTLNLNFQQFENIVSDSADVQLHYYKNSDGDITFTILKATEGSTPVDPTLTAKTVAGQEITVGGTPLTFTANDLATSNKDLALSIAAVATDEATVATAEVTDGKLVITAVAEGTAKVTVDVTDGTRTTQATVNVTVKESGGSEVTDQKLGDFTHTINDNSVGSKVVGFNVNDLPETLKGKTLELVLNNETYQFKVNQFNQDRYTTSVPSTISDADIKAAEVREVK